jgi:uncharacterized membrane protein SirB2
VNKFFNRRSLFIFDGLIFFLVGIAVMIFPSASASSIPTASGSLPHVEDTRRLLAAIYIALGMFLLMFGSSVVNSATRNLAAKLRGLSLPLVTGVNILQITNGNWKPESLYLYVGLFGLMAIAYLYFGFIKPEQD